MQEDAWRRLVHPGGAPVLLSSGRDTVMTYLSGERGAYARELLTGVVSEVKANAVDGWRRVGV